MEDEKAAKKFLEGLGKRSAPWDDGSYVKPRAAAKPAPKAAMPMHKPMDEAMSQAERLAKRNRDIAAKTRHLREN